MLIVQLLPMTVLVLGALFGFMKGVRKMPRRGLAWMIAVGVYSTLFEILQKSLGENGAGVPAIIAMIVSAIVGMVFLAVANKILTPIEKEVKQSDIRKVLEKEEKFRKIEDEEMDELRKERNVDEDDFERLERRQRKRRRRYLEKMKEKTSLISRLIAAAECGVVADFLIAIITDVVALLISASSLSTGALASLYENARFQETLSRADNKVFDYILIAWFMIFVKTGYNKGILNSIHNLLSAFSSMIACVAGFAIPFTALGAEGGALGFTAEIAATISGTIEPMLAGSLPIAIPATVYQVLGKIGVGLAYTIIFLIIAAIMKGISLKWVELSYNNEVFHFFDGCYGIFLGLATGIVLLVIIFIGVLIMERMGWIYSGTGLIAGTHSLEIYNLIKDNFGEIIGKILNFLPIGK
jgi:uncharacterized membrane protein YhiD involved in acid resistance